MLIPTIGLEIHIELNTKSKMFCGCRNNSDETSPNTNVCPVCTAQPGALPVINQKAVEKVIKTALALNCSIEKESFFERKNYFYPDLPKGYQISQYQAPLSRKGFLILDSGKKIGIERIHLEEDTGRLLHQESGGYSLVDFNRAGVPLMELVSQPDIASASEAMEFVKKLQLLLRYINVSEANMEKGQLRAEVNISLRSAQSQQLGVKVEIKNLNSIRVVGKAIEYEIERQRKLLQNGKKVAQETRGWQDAKAITFSQREKESSHDYRYFPEPDLPPLNLKEGYVDAIKSSIPELPSDKRKRFKEEYALPDKEISLYLAQKDLGDYLEKVVSELREWASAELPQTIEESGQWQKLVKLTSNYISTDLQYLLKGKSFTEEVFPISPENFAEFIKLIYAGSITSKIAKMVLEEMFQKGADPSQVIEEKGLRQISDVSEIERIIKEIIEENPQQAEAFKKGKQAVLKYLIGKVMAKTKGTANPQKAKEALEKLLTE